MVNTDEFIKAHITREQRELLLRVVGDRLQDVIRNVWGNRRPVAGEADMLREIRKELEHAGS